MTGSVMTFSAEFRGGYVATLTVAGAGFTCDWSPMIPKLKGTPAGEFLSAYRAWRDECLDTFARTHGYEVRTVPGYPDIIMFKAKPTGSPAAVATVCKQVASA
jgi:hypothetical protein